MNKNFITVLICLLPFTSVVAQKDLNLLPNVPMAETNPYWQDMYKLVKLNATGPKKSSFTEAEESLAAAFAYLHPQSKMKGQQLVADRLIMLIDSALTIWSRGQNLGDMSYTYQVSQAYYMMKLYANDVLPKERIAVWNEGLRIQTEHVFSKTAIYDSLKLGSLWLNGDVRLCLGAYFAGKILGNDAWSKKAERVMTELVPQSLLNGGGTHYCYFHTESPSYHMESKRFIYAWYLLTGSQQYKEMLKKMTPYQLTVLHPIGQGYVEYSSSTPWKPYYAPKHATNNNSGALMAALMFGDSYSATLAKTATSIPWELAFVYRTGLTEKKLPDNFVMFDEGIIGPRGRFGRWGYVGIAREFSTGLPEVKTTDLGVNPFKTTFAGAYILKENPTMEEPPLNAAFHASMPSIKITKGKETNFEDGAVNAYMSTQEKNSLIKTKELYSIASTFSIRGGLHGVTSTAWGGMQQWIYTPNRIIGLLTVKAKSDNQVYGLSNLIKLVCGQGKKMPPTDIKKLVQEDVKTFHYGDLNIAIQAQNYNGAFTHYYEDIMTPLYKVENGKGLCMFELHDEKDSLKDKLITYPADYEKYVLVEVTPKGTEFSKNAVIVATGNPNLKSFEFQEQGRVIRVVHNYSNQKETLKLNFKSAYGKCFLVKSWNDKTLTFNGTQIIKQIEIPANEHLLMISSDNFNNKFNAFKDIFK